MKPVQTAEPSHLIYKFHHQSVHWSSMKTGHWPVYPSPDLLILVTFWLISSDTTLCSSATVAIWAVIFVMISTASVIASSELAFEICGGNDTNITVVIVFCLRYGETIFHRNTLFLRKESRAAIPCRFKSSGYSFIGSQKFSFWINLTCL